MIRYGWTLIWFLFSHLLSAQDINRTLSAQQVMQIVKQYHPVAKQASILIEKSKADLTMARGGFDPVFYNSSAQKTFDGTAYYQYNRPELTIPTWFGLELSAGMEKLSGNRTDPTETLGQTAYVGLSVPLAKNLFMDKRRAVLQIAKIYREASDVEKRNILNNLLLDAMKSYWYWVQHYQIYQILNDAVMVNEKRVLFVKTAFQLGDRAAIDTTEAITQLQNYQVLRENARMNFQNAGLTLSVFLWQENNTPAVLPADVVPADESLLTAVSGVAIPELNRLLDAAQKNHPELLLYNFKLNALHVEKKLKFQSLLPSVNFQYNQLGKGYEILNASTFPLFENNYQYGLTVGLPLRLSEGRGEYRMAKLKITETQLQQNLKLAEVQNKVKAYFNELVALNNQLQVQENAYKNYLTLQRGEEIRFYGGESSLFLINSRENKTLEALQKLQELRAKFLVTVNALQWAAGVLI